MIYEMQQNNKMHFGTGTGLCNTGIKTSPLQTCWSYFIHTLLNLKSSTKTHKKIDLLTL